MVHDTVEARRARQERNYRRAPHLQGERTQRWKAARPDNYAAGKAALRANRNARLAGVPGHLSMQDVLGLWARQPACVSCGENRGIDHVVPMVLGGTNTPDNIQTMCRPCNRAKGPNKGAARRAHAAAA